MSETLLLVAGGIVFLLAGAGIGFLVANMRLKARAAEADEIRRKFDAYRRDVTEHFGRTAEHFQAIGKQYRDLYEHLASGADSFCDTEMLDEKLVYEPAAAVGTSTAATDPAPAELPRDYAEGEYADDETASVTAAGETAGDTTRPETAGEQKAQRPAAAADGDNKKATDKTEEAAKADEDDAKGAGSDLKPEVKSDAEEEKPQPTLH